MAYNNYHDFMKTYIVNLTEDEMKLFSEFLEQKEYAVKHYAPAPARNALAKKAWEMRRKVTPKAITVDKANRMIKAGYSGHDVAKAAGMDNKPVKGGSLNERLSRAGGERIRQEIAKERALLENRYAPKYTPDKFK